MIELLPHYPHLSIVQLVACKFAPKPMLIPLGKLNSEGIPLTDTSFLKGDFNGKPKIASTRFRRGTNRTCFIMPNELDPTHPYVYEITDELDPTRCWSPNDSNSRYATSYRQCKTSESKATYLRKYHSHRFCSGTAMGLIDVTSFDDPTEGTELRELTADNRTLTLSWFVPRDPSVESLFDTRRSAVDKMAMSMANRNVSNKVYRCSCRDFLHDHSADSFILLLSSEWSESFGTLCAQS